MSTEMGVVVVLAVIGGAVLGGLGIFAVLFSARKNLDAESRRRAEDLKGQFTSLAAEVFKNGTEQFLALAESRLETERVKADSDLEEKRRAVETTVSGLAERLKEYEKLMRNFESDRSEKYGSLEEQLREAARTTERLQSTTQRLYSVLSNSRARGQWGERMAEDILRAVGMTENIQYVRDRAVATGASRPDFTFSLPDGHKFYMDVKFPLENYLRMVEAKADEERGRFKAEFLRDVKARIKELRKRPYINPEEGTLDYVVLFIPNEQVYGFVLENLPGLIDETLAQKVVLTSPFSLYAVLAVVRQAFENFHFSRAAKDIFKSVGILKQDFEKFQERFTRLGEQIRKSDEAYSEIAQTSYRRLERAFARIESVREGRKTAATPTEGLVE